LKKQSAANQGWFPARNFFVRIRPMTSINPWVKTMRFAGLGHPIFQFVLVRLRVASVLGSVHMILRCGVNGHFAFGFLCAPTIAAPHRPALQLAMERDLAAQKKLRHPLVKPGSS
jgi:hypothetical protein